MVSRGDVCLTKGLLVLSILASPACRILSQTGSASSFHGDGGMVASARLDADGEVEPTTSAVTELDSGASTESSDVIAPNIDSGISLDTDTEIAVALDAAAVEEADSSALVSTGSDGRSSATGTAFATSSATGSLIATQSQSDAAEGTGKGSDTGTDTHSYTDRLSATVISTVTLTNTTLATGSRTTTSLFTAAGTGTGTGTRTSTNTLTGTGTRSTTGAGTGTRSNTGTSTSTPTGTTSQTSTGIPTSTSTGTGTRTTTATPTATGTTQTSTSTSTPSSTGSFTATSTPTASSTATSGTGTQTSTTMVSVNSIVLDKTTDQIAAGQTDRLTATVLPSNANNRTVAWSTSHAGVATVSSSGLVSAISAGTSTITATTADGGKTATCLVTVVVAVTGVNLDNATATIGLGQTVPLTATLIPENATNQNMIWFSSDETVATVSGTGHTAVVTPVGAGSVTITGVTQDGAKTATCLVTVALSAQWVRTPSTGSAASNFAALAVDGSGNIYAAGAINGTGTFTFGASVTAAGLYAGSNVLLVKYDATGTAKWARTVSTASGASAFTGLTTDTYGNVYAVGTIMGSGSYGFGSSVTTTGAYASGTNLVLVKYDSNGVAKWARSVSDAMGASTYAAIAIDPSGNLYAAGTIAGIFSYGLGSGKSVSGVSASGKSLLLVKYNSLGATQWARSATSGNGESVLIAVSANAIGDIYAAGHIAGTQAYDLGNAITVTGTAPLNALLLQVNVSGIVQWARTSASGSNSSDFTSVATGGNGDVFVGGWINGNTANTFGTGVDITGAYSSGPSTLLLKYDATGVAQWGKSVVSASGISRFAGVTLDQAGNLYAAGLLAGPGTYNFGDSIVATTPSNGNEVLLAKFDEIGGCRAAQTASTQASISGFSAVAADSTGRVYAAGTISGTGLLDFGNSMTAAGVYAGGSNAVLLQYR
jgi:hypothetical protein